MSRFIKTAEAIAAETGRKIDVNESIRILQSQIVERPTASCICENIIVDQFNKGDALCQAFCNRTISAGNLPLTPWTLISCCCSWSGCLGCCVIFCLPDLHCYNEVCITFGGACQCCLSCMTWTIGPGSTTCNLWSPANLNCTWRVRSRDFCCDNLGYGAAGIGTNTIFCCCTTDCCFLTMGYECAPGAGCFGLSGFDITLSPVRSGTVCSCTCSSWTANIKLWTTCGCGLLCKEYDAMWAQQSENLCACGGHYWPSDANDTCGLNKIIMCQNIPICNVCSCNSTPYGYWAIYGRKR